MSPSLLQIIYYLRHNAVNEAYELVRDLEPATPQEYIIKGKWVLFALI